MGDKPKAYISSATKCQLGPSSWHFSFLWMLPSPSNYACLWESLASV